MIETFLKKIFGTKHDREMKRLRPIVDAVNAFEPAMKGLTDEQLRAKTQEFREKFKAGATLDDICPEAFAVCREASIRVLGMRHYDVQVIGGLVLHSGRIAEMKTGEGKTLVATLAVYLNALSGKGVHVVTVNDYLAKRDAEWMGRVYKFLGLTVGIIVHDLDDSERKEAYNSDVIYATNNELGFDYLRDNMKFSLQDYVQRELNFAIVDECDSILIDEARTPLIISGPAEASTDKYMVVNRIVPYLKKDVHFTMEEKSKTASLTEEGNAKVEELLGISNLFDPQNIEILHHVYQGLKAHHLYNLDVDYMIKDGEIVIVDEFTGRLMPGRRWSDGLHQAIEAKENVKVKNENQTLATITFQNFFRMYNKLAGMTGTADTEAVEFRKIYNLDVSVIPTNKPVQRADLDDVVYKNQNAKFKAICTDIKARQEKGQPVLVGTVSIEKSEMLSQFLKKEGIKHNVLNAKHHAREAEFIAQAGRKGSVTIATNMAGRGTDIVLGGNAENMAKQVNPDTESEEFQQALEKFRPQCESERKHVVEAGGLYIVGTERHESRRIDNQLRGRSGRQGDPGESRFYLALDDNLMRIFNGEKIQQIMGWLNVPEDEPISHRMVTNSIADAQKRVEGHNFDIRKHLLDYDDVMNKQRHVIYGLRRKILEGREVEQTVLEMLGDVTSEILDVHIPEGAKSEQWDLKALNISLHRQFGISLDLPTDTNGSSGIKSESALIESVKTAVRTVYDHQKSKLGPFFEQIQRMVLLQSIDQRWKEHLLLVDHLKEGINLRGYASKDPLIEYKKEAFGAFEKLDNIIKSDTIEKTLKVQIVLNSDKDVEDQFNSDSYDDNKLNYSGANEDIGQFQGKQINPTQSSAPLSSSPLSSVPQPQQRQKMTLSQGDQEAEPEKLNRSQRRMMSKRKR